MFTAAFEDSMAVDYVTEKVYDALHAGSVPLYLGAPNILEFVPPNSVINVLDFVDERTGEVDVDALAGYVSFTVVVLLPLALVYWWCTGVLVYPTGNIVSLASLLECPVAKVEPRTGRPYDIVLFINKPR